MYPRGYIAQVTNLSPTAKEKDLRDFFSYCGFVEHVEIIRYEECSCTAYVTFRDAFALETAVLLSGATIIDQTVYISTWGEYFNEHNIPTLKTEGDYSVMLTHTDAFASSPGEAVTVAQEVVKTMIARGYVLGKDAIVKAKAFDESHKLTTVAAAKFAEFSHRIGLTQNIQSSIDAVKSADDKYHFSDFTKSAVLVTGTAAVAAATIAGRAAAATGNAVVNSRFFANGALWVADALDRAAKAAAEMGGRASK